MPIIDLDHGTITSPVRLLFAEGRTTAAAVVIVIAALAVCMTHAQASKPPALMAETAATQVITTAEPSSQAAVAIFTADGGRIDRPPLGRPIGVDRPAQIQVFVSTRDTDDGASCTIVVDGVLVAENAAVGPGVVASCSWPR